MEKSKYEVALEIANQFELSKWCKKFASYQEVSKNSMIYSQPKDLKNLDTALNEYLKRFEKILRVLEKS